MARTVQSNAIIHALVLHNILPFTPEVFFRTGHVMRADGDVLKGSRL